MNKITIWDRAGMSIEKTHKFGFYVYSFNGQLRGAFTQSKAAIEYAREIIREKRQDFVPRTLEMLHKIDFPFVKDENKKSKNRFRSKHSSNSLTTQK